VTRERRSLIIAIPTLSDLTLRIQLHFLDEAASRDSHPPAKFDDSAIKGGQPRAIKHANCRPVAECSPFIPRLLQELLGRRRSALRINCAALISAAALAIASPVETSRCSLL